MVTASHFMLRRTIRYIYTRSKTSGTRSIIPLWRLSTRQQEYNHFPCLLRSSVPHLFQTLPPHPLHTPPSHPFSVEVVEATAGVWMCSKWNCQSSGIRYLSGLNSTGSKESFLLNHISYIDLCIGPLDFLSLLPNELLTPGSCTALLNALLEMDSVLWQKFFFCFVFFLVR